MLPHRCDRGHGARDIEGLTLNLIGLWKRVCAPALASATFMAGEPYQRFVALNSDQSLRSFP